MVKRSLVALFLLISSLFGQTVTYDVSFGSLKGLGKAQATMTKEGEMYLLAIDAYALGVAGLLSQNRHDRYESKGVIKEGVFLPSLHTATTITDQKKVETRYIFDHQAHQVTKEKYRLNEENLTLQTQETLPYYATNDILSLYFNIVAQIPKFVKGAKNIFHAVGANKTDGRVDVTLPDGAWEEELKKELGFSQGDRYLVVTINQKIFMSENGELYLRINPQGVCTHALLKDVMMFGDIKGVIVP